MDMGRHQQLQREKLYRLLGKLPIRQGIPGAELIERREGSDMLIERLTLDLNGLEPVPAYFIKPVGKEGPLPLVIYNHSHGGFYDVGKDEAVKGAPYLQQPAYAEALTREGYAVLCIDHWAFGERNGRSEGKIFKEMLWKGRVMWGMMVYDSIRALDYACSRPDVDAGRIAALGMSMGSTMTWWLAALDTRIKAAVDLCALSDYDTLLETGAYDGHNFYYFVPGLLEQFGAQDINGLIAPRPHLSLAGTLDKFTQPAGLDVIDAAARETYAAFGAADNWKQLRYEAGHEETAEMRAEALAFLRAHL